MNRLRFVSSRNLSKLESTDQDINIILDENQDYKFSLKNWMNKVCKISKSNIYSHNIEWTQKWAFSKFDKHSSFADKLVFENKTFWYPLEFFLHNFFLHYDLREADYDISISRIMIYIDTTLKIIKEFKPDEIIIENNQTFFNRIVIKICKHKKIKITNLNFKEQKKNLLRGLMHNPLIIRNYLKSRILLRAIIGKLFCKKIKLKDVLILTSDRLSNKENITDYYWGPIVKELNRKGLGYKMVEYDRIDSLNSLEQVKKRYLPQKYDAQFIGTYYDNSTIRDMRKMISFLRKKFREIDKRKDFRESFNYKGIRFYDLIRPRLKKIFLTYSYYIADVYAISKSVIEKEKPKIILVDHEKNYYGRALITEAKKKGITSFAFEGEIVYENNTYLTQAPIKIILNGKNPLWRPIPDKKLLWGEYTQNWYRKRNYFPEKNLKIIGTPKYDFLKELNENDRKGIRRKYGVEDDEKLVIIITVSVPWGKESLEVIFKSLKSAKKLKVVVKMHPNDPVLSKKMIETLIKKFNVRGVVVRYENTSKLIYASDLIITCPSTLVYECILLNKPTILVELGDNISQPYILSGLLKNYTNPDEIKDIIKKSLTSNKRFNPKERQKFIRKYLYLDDGKASERAVNEIKKILSKRER